MISCYILKLECVIGMLIFECFCVGVIIIFVGNVFICGVKLMVVLVDKLVVMM